jgi:serine/threonine-protein kinase
LEALGRSVERSPGAATVDLVAPGGATVDHVTPRPPAAPAPLTGATVDLAPDATTEHSPTAAPPARADGTMDYVPGANAATGVAHETASGGTVDYKAAPEAKPQPKAPDKAARAEAPATVAGYEVLSVLGRGAMGVVYKARQRGLNRLVALKMILAGEHAGSHELNRFQAEAEAVAHLRHPNIVQIYEVGEEQGLPFFSLEFVEGSSLDRKANGTPMPPVDAARMVLKLARAMDYAHKSNIVHRDLKPANVLLTQDGEPKIGDFGLAKRIDEDAGQTRTGTVLGTPSYMAPEQAEGRLREVGPLSDEYSLGAILYELLTGRPPFKGSTILDTLNQLRTLEPVPPIEFQPGVPRDLETICLKCLQKDPQKRYAGCGEMAEDLRRFLAGEPIAARPVSRRERLWRWCKRNPRVAGLTAAVAALLVLGVVGLAAFSMVLRHERDQTKLAWIEADKNAADARQQEAIANEKKEEADRNATVAKEKQEEADRSAAVARENETRAKATAQLTVEQMIDLGRKVHKRLSVQDSPEVRRLRDDVLTVLRESLVVMSQGVQELGITNFGQAFSYQTLGDLLTNLGAKQEALRAYQHSYDLIKRVVDAEPDNDLARGNLGVMVLRLGNVALDLEGDAGTARTRYARARDLHREILTHPRSGYFKEVDAKRLVSHDDIGLGRSYLALGQTAEARKCFEESLQYRQDWSDAEPQNNRARSHITESRMWLGIASVRLGDAKAADEHFGEAARLTQALAEKFSDDFTFKRDLSEIRGAWGDALLRQGKEEEADKAFQESLKNLRLVIDHDPEDLEAQQDLALTHARLGAVSARRHQPQEAGTHYKEALKLETALLRLEPANVTRQAARALALARCGQHAEAAAEAAKVLPGVVKCPELLLQIARTYATCAAAGTPQKADYLKQALAALQAATDKDFKDAAALQADPDLEAVRGEAAFKAIVEKVKAR